MCDISVMEAPQHVGRVRAKYDTDPTVGGQELLLVMVGRSEVTYRSRDDLPKLMAAISDASDGARGARDDQD